MFQDLPYDPELQIDTTPTALFPVSCLYATSRSKNYRQAGAADFIGLTMPCFPCVLMMSSCVASQT